ncbi:hypothetical protein [Devosia elaeis]|uniref:Uncharacterized protein n=1 Tax=Devosia elaeis TaxID=1770058 RepID=A0A178I1L6_9HYPH|nr:hypothetical protein [Devosia elaeis]OAM78194.1 hypothetical protein A3840_06735 [Devosia elaeis]
MFKIIGKDNWDRETVADVLVADNIRSERDGKKMVDALNEGANDHTPRWHVLVPASHKLWRGMEEFI